MPELLDWSQGGFTQPMDSWDSYAAPWDASDVLANAAFRTAAQERVADSQWRITIVRQREIPSRPIQEAIRQALTLLRLRDGWNSHSAKPVSMEAVRDAITFLIDAASEIPNIAAPTVVPTVRAGMQLEWHQQGIDIEVEFGSGGPASWYAEDRTTGEISEAPVAGQENALRVWLSRASD